MICNICKHTTTSFAQAQILDKYTIHYFRCNHCKFIQTEDPYWLKEAYTRAINESDIGLVNRNILFSGITKAVLLFFDAQAKFMDYGGGYGLFVRMMRDAGFDFYRYDQYCENIFAKGFEADHVGTHQYEILTAFEVFEHFANPLDEIEQMLRFSKNILFSTMLIPPHIPKPDAWWYYGLDHGQHISLYTPQALSVIANTFNLNLYSNKVSLHLLTEKKIHPLFFYFITHSKMTKLLGAVWRKKSLLADDYSRITGGKSLT